MLSRMGKEMQINSNMRCMYHGLNKCYHEPEVL